MKTKDEANLCFVLDDGTEIIVESFVLEKSANEAMAGYGSDETEDETIARHLLNARRIWVGILAVSG